MIAKASSSSSVVSISTLLFFSGTSGEESVNVDSSSSLASAVLMRLFKRSFMSYKCYYHFNDIRILYGHSILC